MLHRQQQHAGRETPPRQLSARGHVGYNEFLNEYWPLLQQRCHTELTAFRSHLPPPIFLWSEYHNRIRSFDELNRLQRLEGIPRSP